MEFSQIVKSLRLERGWSQQEVADRAGLNKMTISQYENGKRKPSFEVIEALAEIFHVDMNYLLGYTDKIEKPAGDETEPARRYSNPEDHRAAGLCRPQNCRMKQKSPGGCRGSLSLSCICWLPGIREPPR